MSPRWTAWRWGLRYVAGLGVFALLSGCAGGLSEASPCPPHRAQSLVRLLNETRRHEGLPRLWVDRRLAAAAQHHADDLATGMAQGHVGSERSTPGDRITAAGFRASRYGENIASGHLSSEAVLSGWMDSPPHRSTILEGRFRAVGIGISAGRGGPHWVADFATVQDEILGPRERCHPPTGVR